MNHIRQETSDERSCERPVLPLSFRASNSTSAPRRESPDDTREQRSKWTARGGGGRVGDASFAWMVASAHGTCARIRPKKIRRRLSLPLE